MLTTGEKSRRDGIVRLNPAESTEGSPNYRGTHPSLPLASHPWGHYLHLHKRHTQGLPSCGLRTGLGPGCVGLTQSPHSSTSLQNSQVSGLSLSKAHPSKPPCSQPGLQGALGTHDIFGGSSTLG